MLGRVRIRCPLWRVDSVKCTWCGDYSELHAHMTLVDSHRNRAKDSRTSHRARMETCEICHESEGKTFSKDGSGHEKREDFKRMRNSNGSEQNMSETQKNSSDGASSYQNEREQSISMAGALKEQGNARFAEGQYREAIQLYSRAISFAEPNNPVYLNNRATAWFKIGAYKESIVDCRRALEIDCYNIKAINRLGKCLSFTAGSASAMAHYDEAIDLLTGKSLDTSAIKAEADRTRRIVKVVNSCKAELERGNAVQARIIFRNELNLLNKYDSPEISLLSSRIAIATGEIDEAKRITRRLLLTDSTMVDALVVRAGALYQTSGQVEAKSSMQHIREALRLDPDHREAKTLLKHVKFVQQSVEKGRNAVKSRTFEEAIQEFTAVLNEPEGQFKQTIDLTESEEDGDVNISEHNLLQKSSPFPLHYRSTLAVEGREFICLLLC